MRIMAALKPRAAGDKKDNPLETLLLVTAELLFRVFSDPETVIRAVFGAVKW